MAEIRSRLGLELPALTQLANYLTNLSRFNLGMSGKYNIAVSSLILERFPNTLLLMGTTLAFPPSPKDGDPRKSIVERYRDRDDYIAQARRAASALAAERYILEEDIELAVTLAVERYDLLVPAFAMR